MNLNWVQIGSLLMFLAVALGAFGSHALKSKLSPHYFEVFQTGVLYHFIHAFAIFLVAWLGTQSDDPNIQFAGVAFLTGIVFFSGSLYLLSISEVKAIALFTPIGGVLFLAGWVLLFISRYKGLQ
ncbi:MAG: DUF423 domain-containing protein [Candidatus Omnitrophica bacterium]|nr:DUF423 domain-containing protein [Candidatus Omnitrophota bacterium]